MTGRFALAATRIFDGDAWHEDGALIVADGIVEAIVPRSSLPAEMRVVETKAPFSRPASSTFRSMAAAA
jgi:N-acetylglucosamine-6-phosphate deacetylase